jgi:hypothetical protein
MSDPDKVVDFVIDKIDNNANTKEHFLRLMAGGTTVEEIVNTVALGGFTAGEFNPDVAEIIIHIDINPPTSTATMVSIFASFSSFGEFHFSLAREA